MSDPVEAGVDAGLMEAADALLTRLVPLMTQARRRDAIYATLLTERRRAEAAMRERAANAVKALGAQNSGRYADAILALPITEDTP